VADEVDATVKLVEPTDAQPLTDLVACDSRRKQLPPGHDTMLPARNPGYQLISV
jgi:hypothetical protein